MTKVNYKDGRLYITNCGPWGEFNSLEFNPSDLEPADKSALLRAMRDLEQSPEEKNNTIEDRIEYILHTRGKVMTAAEGVIEQQMKEYVEKFGWDPKTDMWIWNGLGDCGIGYLIAVGNTTNAAVLTGGKEGGRMESC